MQSETPDAAAILKAASALGMLGGERVTAQRLLAALCNSQLSAREAITLIERDPGLTARVLKVSNSSFYGRAREVETVTRAVSVLGLDAVRGIAAAACLDRALPAGNSAPLPDSSQLVRHSLGTALAAERLALVRLPSLAPDAFIAGLLHDLGAVIQARVDPAGFRRMIDSLAADPSQDLLEVERRCVQVTQQQCSRIVFGQWQLPDAIVEAICHHHAPSAAPASHLPVASLVHLANYISLLAGLGFCAEIAAGACDAHALSAVGVEDADAGNLTAELNARVEQFLLQVG